MHYRQGPKEAMRGGGVAFGRATTSDSTLSDLEPPFPTAGTPIRASSWEGPWGSLGTYPTENEPPDQIPYDWHLAPLLHINEGD